MRGSFFLSGIFLSLLVPCICFAQYTVDINVTPAAVGVTQKKCEDMVKGATTDALAKTQCKTACSPNKPIGDPTNVSHPGCVKRGALWRPDGHSVYTCSCTGNPSTMSISDVDAVGIESISKSTDADIELLADIISELLAE